MYSHQNCASLTNIFYSIPLKFEFALLPQCDIYSSSLNIKLFHYFPTLAILHMRKFSNFKDHRWFKFLNKLIGKPSWSSKPSWPKKSFGHDDLHKYFSFLSLTILYYVCTIVDSTDTIFNYAINFHFNQILGLEIGYNENTFNMYYI